MSGEERFAVRRNAIDTLFPEKHFLGGAMKGGRLLGACRWKKVAFLLDIDSLRPFRALARVQFPTYLATIAGVRVKYH